MMNPQGVTPAADVRTVQYMLRRNLGNYEHEEIVLSGSVRDGADPMYAVNHLKTLAKMALYAEPQYKEEAIAKALTEAPKTIAHKVKLADEPKAEATFVKGADEEAPSYPQADGTTSSVPGEIPPPIPQEAKAKRTRTTKPKEEKEEMIPVESPFKAHSSEKSEEPKEEKKEVKQPAGETKVEKGTKTAPHISYDRTVKEHRSTMATYLNTYHKGWQTKKPQDLIVTFSGGLHGKPFMDAKGNILDSFKAELAEFFG